MMLGFFYRGLYCRADGLVQGRDVSCQIGHGVVQGHGLISDLIGFTQVGDRLEMSPLRVAIRFWESLEGAEILAAYPSLWH